MIGYQALGKLGNLGNHLFQIASTIGIAKANNTDYGFPEWKYEEYFENPLPHKSFLGKEIEEKFYHFDDSLLKLGSSNYNLKGYYQTEKYWQHAKDEVKKQFTFKKELKDKVQQKFAQAFSRPLVAISIRRGDFVKNKFYHQVPISYYLSAYYKYFPDHNILIFTDDFAYCKLHFEALDNVYFTEGLDAIEQLCLMSMCDNFIISNSTFSWWGAYLSGSKNVIRPVKNLSNEGAKTHDEKDYWQSDWMIHNERIDLKDTTFIIPVFYDHNDRRQNIMLTVSFLLKNFNTNILIGEQGGNEFSFMAKYCRYINFDQMEHFHRTRMINEMVKKAETEIVVNWDGDNLCTPAQLYESAKAVRNGADIVYPFDGRVCRVPRYLFPDVIESLDVHDIKVEKCMPKTHSSVGHAVVMKRGSFINAGMENENFISWGPEDSERYDRYHILELTVKRIQGKIYHMDHYCGANSSTQHPHFSQNNLEHYKVKGMKKIELREYVNSWGWVK